MISVSAAKSVPVDVVSSFLPTPDDSPDKDADVNIKIEDQKQDCKLITAEPIASMDNFINTKVKQLPEKKPKPKAKRAIKQPKM